MGNAEQKRKQLEAEKERLGEQQHKFDLEQAKDSKCQEQKKIG